MFQKSLLKMEAAAPPKVGKYMQVKRGIISQKI
jgi:hypothetical protein